MASLSSRRYLAHLLSAFSTTEKSVELSRQVLAENPDFEPYTAFKRINRSRNGKITELELLSFLEESAGRVTDQESNQLFNLLDKDEDGVVSYEEFMDAILPKQNEPLKKRALLREPYYVGLRESLPKGMELELSRVFEKEVDNLRVLNRIKTDLNNCFDFSPLNLFEVLDDNKQGFLDYESVENFMKETSRPMAEGEIEAIFLRVDRNKDGKIDFKEFREAVRVELAAGRGSSGLGRSRSPAQRRERETEERGQEEREERVKESGVRPEEGQAEENDKEETKKPSPERNQENRANYKSPVTNSGGSRKSRYSSPPKSRAVLNMEYDDYLRSEANLSGSGGRSRRIPGGNERNLETSSSRKRATEQGDAQEAPEKQETEKEAVATSSTDNQRRESRASGVSAQKRQETEKEAVQTSSPDNQRRVSRASGVSGVSGQKRQETEKEAVASSSPDNQRRVSRVSGVSAQKREETEKEAVVSSSTDNQRRESRASGVSAQKRQENEKEAVQTSSPDNQRRVSRASGVSGVSGQKRQETEKEAVASSSPDNQRRVSRVSGVSAQKREETEKEAVVSSSPDNQRRESRASGVSGQGKSQPVPVEENEPAPRNTESPSVRKPLWQSLESNGIYSGSSSRRRRAPREEIIEEEPAPEAENEETQNPQPELAQSSLVAGDEENEPEETEKNAKAGNDEQPEQPEEEEEKRSNVPSSGNERKEARNTPTGRGNGATSTIASSEYRSSAEVRRTSERNQSSLSPVRESPSRLRSSSPARASPLRVRDEMQLAKYLNQIIESSAEAEKYKNDLALRVDFNLTDAFRLFDTNNKGSISQRQLENGLSRLGIYSKPDDAYLFFRRFNTSESGLLRSNEFADALVPKQPEYAELVSRRESTVGEDFDEQTVFTVETRRLFRRVLNILILNEKTAERVREGITSQGYSLEDAFNYLDKNQDGFITPQEFQETLGDYGIFVTRQEVASLMERYDTNKRGRVSYRDFLAESRPKSPSRY